MDVRQLPENLKVRLRSATIINTITHCVLELVLNSLDAKASSVAVRVNLHSFRVQVVDNGCGISTHSMEKVGLQHMTNKCHRTRDIEGKFKFHGYKGESLFSIGNLSSKLEIVSRFTDTTYRLTICGNHRTVVQDKCRPSTGTTVTVQNFLHNQPVRQKRINQVIDMEQIKKCLIYLSIINPNVSFTLRNDAIGNIIFKCHKTESVLQSFTGVYDIFVDNVHKIKINKDNLKIAGLISTKTHTNNKLQLIYVNKRPIHSKQIQKMINTTLLNNDIFKASMEIFETVKSKIHPIYVINIECPHSEVTYSFDSIYFVEFNSFDAVSKLLERAVKNFLRRQTYFNSQKSNNTIEINSSLGFKRKLSSVGSKDSASRVKSIENLQNENKENEHGVGKRTKKKVRKDTIQLPKSKKLYQITVSKDEIRKNVSDEDANKENVKFISQTSNNNVENCVNIFNDVAPLGSSQISSTLPQNFSENIFNYQMDGKEVIMDMFFKSVEFFSQKLKKQVLKTTFADKSPEHVEDREMNVDKHGHKLNPSVHSSNHSFDDLLQPLQIFQQNSMTLCDFVPPISKSQEINNDSKTCSQRLATESLHEENKLRNIKKAVNFITRSEHSNDSGQLVDNILHDVSFSNHELKAKRMKNLNAVGNIVINKKLNRKPVEKEVQSSFNMSPDNLHIFSRLNANTDFTFNSSHVVTKKPHKTKAPVVGNNRHSDKECFNNKNKSFKLSSELERDASVTSCKFNDEQLQENPFVIPKQVQSVSKQNFHFDVDDIDVNPPSKFSEHKSSELTCINGKTNDKSAELSGNLKSKMENTRTKSQGVRGTRHQGLTQQNKFNFDTVEVQRTCHDNKPGARLENKTVKSSSSQEQSKYDFDVDKFVINSGKRCNELRRTKSFQVNDTLSCKQKVVRETTKDIELNPKLYNAHRKISETSDIGKKFNFDAEIVGLGESIKYNEEIKSNAKKTSDGNRNFVPVGKGGNDICHNVMKHHTHNSLRSPNEAHEHVSGNKMYYCGQNTRRSYDGGGGFHFYFDKLPHNIHVDIGTKQFPSSHSEADVKKGGSVVCINVNSKRASEMVDLSKKHCKENPSTGRTEKTTKMNSQRFNLSVENCLSGKEFDQHDFTFKSHYVESAKGRVFSLRNVEKVCNMNCRNVREGQTTERHVYDPLELSSVCSKRINYLKNHCDMKKKKKSEFYNPMFPSKINEGDINNSHDLYKSTNVRSAHKEYNNHDKVANLPNLTSYKFDFNSNEKQFGKGICNVYTKESNYIIEDNTDAKQLFYKSLFATENINGNNVDAYEPFNECNHEHGSAVKDSTQVGNKNVNKIVTTHTEDNQRYIDNDVNSYNSFVEGLVKSNCILIQNTPICYAANSSNSKYQLEGDVSKYFESKGKKSKLVTEQHLDGQTSFYFNKSVYVHPRDESNILCAEGMGTSALLQHHRNTAGNFGGIIDGAFETVENHNPTSGCKEMEQTRREPTGDDVKNVCSFEEDDYRDKIFDRPAGQTCENQEQQMPFTLKKRYGFIPKGMSPLLVETKECNVSLSPTSKRILRKETLKAFEDEVDLVKWKNYINDEDPRQFFDKLYAEKCKLVQAPVPNINSASLPSYLKRIQNDTANFSFTKTILADIQIVGQVDSKFIVAVSRDNLVILFDQHAVDERVRLEKLMKDYTVQDLTSHACRYKSVECEKPLEIELLDTELHILQRFKGLYDNLGLSFDVHRKHVTVRKVPLCLQRKSVDEVRELVTALIVDGINMLRTTRGVVSKVPKCLQRVINSEACRAAIKFGDKLTIEECQKHLKALSTCDLPFQCAHGRPTLTPLLKIDVADQKPKSSVNFTKLFCHQKWQTSSKD